MTLDRPDFSQAVVPSMPVAGEGQVPWFQSEAALIAATDNEDLISYVVPDDYELHVCSGVVSCDFPVHQRYDLRATPAATWISPTSHSDPDSEWDNEEYAYDGDIDTLARGLTEAGVWGGFLILLVNEIYINEIRYFPYHDLAFIDEVDVDAYYAGTWNHIFQGAYTPREWNEKDIPAPAKLISKARVRFHNTIAHYYYCYLAEFQFNTSGATPQEGIYFDTHAIIPYLPQAPYLVEAGATFAVRVYNDDGAAHNMSVSLGGFLQKKAGA